jgi:hypothetical protein
MSEVYIAPQPQPFETFKPYINTGGLPSSLTPESYINLLQQLHGETGHLWKEGNCAKATSITIWLQTLLEISKLETMTAKTFIFYPHHSWTEISTPDSKVIIDPFGVLDTDPSVFKIIPYFGVLKDLSKSQSFSASAWTTYSHGRPLSQREEALMLIYS